MNTKIVSLFRGTLAEVGLFIFLVLFGWWIALHFFVSNLTNNNLQLWAASYQIISLYGAIIGFITAKRWGGISSVLGRALTAFSLGLLFQSFGQSCYSFFIYYLHIDIPYPSIGDIGFFGSVLFYIYGALNLGKAAGVRVSLKSFHNQMLAILLPVLLLCLSYAVFLKGYEFDGNFLKTFLDFGYPLGEAFYVSLAIITFILSRRFLGGMMKIPTIFFLLALLFQYISDFTFLYQSSHGTWFAGGLNDLMYSFSYLLMSLSLIYVGKVFDSIKST